MKSIVEQASSITKAIEKCWERAGKPESFTVKVLELPKKNFFGMTVKSAKVALYFEQKTQTKKRGWVSKGRKKQITDKKYDKPKYKEQKHTPKVTASESRKKESFEERPKKPTSMWSDQMVQSAAQWLEQALFQMGIENAPFTTSVKRQHVIFQFNKPIADSIEKERMIFRSFAHLMLQSLRNHYKKNLRGMKVILNSAE